MRKIIFLTLFTLIISGLRAQIYLADNGLTASGTGTSKKVSLGGTLLNAQTAIDFGSANASSNFLIKKGTTNYFFVGNNGNVGINTITPNVKFEIDNTTTGTSGLRFTRLLSTSTASASNGRLLTVNSTGDIILANDIPSMSQTANFILAGPSSGAAAVPSFRTLVTADIPNSIVTYAKIQNVTGLRLLGNTNASAGAAGEISIGSGLSLSGGILSATGGGSGWSLTGNAGTTSSNFIGTTDNQPLIFKTNNAEAGRILTDGDLLLGTTTDNGAYKIQTTIPASGNGLFVDGSVNAGVALKVKAKDQTWAWHAENGIAQVGLQNQISGSAWTLDAVNTTFSIIGRSANVQLATDAFADILILPGKKLKVNLGSDATGDIYYRNGTGDFTRLPAGTNGQVLTVTSGLPAWATGSGGSSQWTTAASNIYYTAGKVGIGTMNLNDASYKLFVEGAIRSRKIRVDQLAWPDYVFHYHYKLRSLKEVEEFIKLNNHLPDVPSANEIEKEGLDLGDNQAILLKKIEELTLYLIDQDKKIQELEKQNAELKEIRKQLALLKKRIGGKK